MLYKLFIKSLNFRDFYQINESGMMTPLKGETLRDHIFSVVNRTFDEISVICEETILIVDSALESVSGEI